MCGLRGTFVVAAAGGTGLAAGDSGLQGGRVGVELGGVAPAAVGLFRGGTAPEHRLVGHGPRAVQEHIVQGHTGLVGRQLARGRGRGTAVTTARRVVFTRTLHTRDRRSPIAKNIHHHDRNFI